MATYAVVEEDVLCTANHSSLKGPERGHGLSKRIQRS